MNTKNVLERIEAKLAHCSKGQKKIGEYLLANYAEAAFMTAAKLSETVGISESTIVRYATDLGFDGYPSLQAALKYAARSKLTSVERIKLTKSVNGDIESIKKTAQSLNRKDFDNFIEKIAAAQRIYIVGARSSASLAVFLNFYLSILYDNVTVVHTVIGSEAFDQMFRVKEGDVVIGLTFPRYSKLTLDVLEFAKKAGAAVLGITDSVHSPLAKLADITLFAPNENETFVDSLTAPLALINAILTELAARNPENTASRFEILERIWAENDVYN